MASLSLAEPISLHMENYGRPSFSRVLLTIANAYREKKDEVDEQANMVLNAVSHAETFAGKSADSVPANIVETIVADGEGAFRC